MAAAPQDGDILRADGACDTACDIGHELLLHLEAMGFFVGDSGELRETEDAAGWPNADGDIGPEVNQVVLALRPHLDRTDEDKVVVRSRRERRIECARVVLN